MPEHPWNIVFLIGFVVYVGIRHVFIRRTRKNEHLARRFGLMEKVLFAIVSAGTLFLPATYLVSPWLSFADYSLPSAAPWLGALIMIAAVWLFWRSHADLGLNWSVKLELRKGHELVTQGVYLRIRHPMYAAILLFSIAQGLLLENWLAGWAACATFAPLYFFRTPREEQMMCEHFGDEYRAYMARTGRLIPFPFGR